MGGPKALLDLPGGPLVAQHAARLLAAGADEVVVVTRPECVRALVALAMERVVVIGAETPEPAASLAVALSRDLAASLVMITTVDSMPPTPATLALLLEAIERGGADAAVPTFGGRGGHPIVARTEILAAYGPSSSSRPPLRDVLRALGARTARIRVDDPHVRVDLDTPSDVVAHFGVAPRFLPTPE